jgi:hypothetical protein
LDNNLNNKNSELVSDYGLTIISATFTPWEQYQISEYDLERYIDKINLALSLMDSNRGVEKGKKMIKRTLLKLEERCKSKIIK